MKILPRNDFKTALTSLQNVPFNTLFASSVLEEHVKGKVFVDVIDNPNAYYIIHPSGMSLLYGDINNKSFKENLKNYLLGQKNLRRSDESLQVVPGELEYQIDSMLAESMCLYSQINKQEFMGYKVAKDRRRNFKFNEEAFVKIRADINLEKLQFSDIDVTLFEKIIGAAVPNQFWDNATNFLKFGKGYSIMQENRPVATAFSSFVHKNMLEIGVETVPECRKKGLGSLVCVKLISYCLDNYLKPIWSCRYGNEGSVGLANKLGFEHTIEIPYYELLN